MILHFKININGMLYILPATTVLKILPRGARACESKHLGDFQLHKGLAG